MRTFELKPLAAPSSVIELGTMIFHPDTQERDHGLLDAFVDAGGTYVDTAEVYGAVEEHGYSEMVIGEWLAARPERRGRIILAAKGLIPGYCAPLHPGGASIGPGQIHAAIDGSLARLKTDCLDIRMFHRDDPSLDAGPLVDALDEEIRAGRIRAWGGVQPDRRAPAAGGGVRGPRGPGRPRRIQPAFFPRQGQGAVLARHGGHRRRRPRVVREARPAAGRMVLARARLHSRTGARATRATPIWCGCSIPPATSGASSASASSPGRGA